MITKKEIELLIKFKWLKEHERKATIDFLDDLASFVIDHLAWIPLKSRIENKEDIVKSIKKGSFKEYESLFTETPKPIKNKIMITEEEVDLLADLRLLKRDRSRESEEILQELSSLIANYYDSMADDIIKEKDILKLIKDSKIKENGNTLN